MACVITPLCMLLCTAGYRLAGPVRLPRLHRALHALQRPELPHPGPAPGWQFRHCGPGQEPGRLPLQRLVELPGHPKVCGKVATPRRRWGGGRRQCRASGWHWRLRTLGVLATIHYTHCHSWQSLWALQATAAPLLRARRTPSRFLQSSPQATSLVRTFSIQVRSRDLLRSPCQLSIPQRC